MYNTFKVRAFFHTPLNMPGTYKERITSIPPTPILWKSEDSAPSHKVRTEILTEVSNLPYEGSETCAKVVPETVYIRTLQSCIFILTIHHLRKETDKNSKSTVIL